MPRDPIKARARRKRYFDKPGNRDRWNAHFRERREARRIEALAALGGRCVRCWSDEDLHFDHIDPATKCYDIGNILVYRKETLDAELAKCQLLCGQCHRDKTIEKREYSKSTPRHGSAYLYNEFKCRCEECRAWKREYDQGYRARKKNRSQPTEDPPQ